MIFCQFDHFDEFLIAFRQPKENEFYLIMSTTAVSPLARAITPTLESQAYAIDRATELLKRSRYGEGQGIDFDRTLSNSLGDLRDGQFRFSLLFHHILTTGRGIF